MSCPDALRARPRLRARSLRFPALLGAISLAALAQGACASPPPPPQPPPQAPPPAPPPVIVASPWRAVPIAPPPTGYLFQANVDDGLLLVDESGVRWLFPTDESEPRVVATPDLEPFVLRRADDSLGALAVTVDERVLATKTALGPFSLVARLPDKADHGSFRALGRGLTVRVQGNLFALGKSGELGPVAPMKGYAPVDAVIDENGRGVGLFAPETVATTRDGGVVWTPLATPGVTVTSVGTFEGKPILQPGGVRDGFPRSVDLATGALERVYLPEGGARARRSFTKPMKPPVRAPLGQAGDDGAHEQAAPKPVRLQPRARLGPTVFTQVLSGDRAMLLPSAPAGKDKRQPVLIGTLGEGMLPAPFPALDRCTPVSSALCGDVAAIACTTRVEVFRGDKSIASFPVNKRVTVGFTPDGKLVSLSRDAKTRAASLQRYDVEAAPKVDEVALGDLPGRTDQLIGGCHHAALWVSTGTHVARWEEETFGAATELPARARAVDVNADRELVLVRSAEPPIHPLGNPAAPTAPNEDELLFLPSGQSVPAAKLDAERLSLAEDGRHGLRWASPTEVFQTDDGGHTWARIAAPSTSARPGVLCGATRCLLGSGVFREGFVKDPAYQPPTEEPKPTTATTGSPAVTAPVVMRCSADPASFVGAPRMRFGVTPRLGRALFAGLDGLDDEAGKSRIAVFGDVGGQASVQKLGVIPKIPAEPTITEEGFVAGAPGLLARNQRVYPTSVVARAFWEAGAPPHVLREKDAYRSSFQDPELVGEDVVGKIGGFGTMLVWGKTKPAEHGFPTLNEQRGPGVLVVESDGAMRAALAPTDGSARVVLLHADAPARDRTFLVRTDRAVESAIGLFAGGAPRIVLAERTEDGGSELRIRPLGDGLALGPATVVPGTHAASDDFFDLPSCAAPPAGGTTAGALVRTIGRDRVTFLVGGVEATGILQRFLRVTETGACVERTLLAGDRDSLAGEVVTAGNGGLGVGPLDKPGLRCERLEVHGASPTSATPTKAGRKRGGKP